MYIFAFTVLQDALDELATKQTRSGRNPRRDECMTAIRACMELLSFQPTNWRYTQTIWQALTELAGIARQDGEIMIEAQLRSVARELALASGQSYLRERSARVAHADG